MARFKIISRYLLGLFFVLAGLTHLLHPTFYMRMMPPYLPWHPFLVNLSGIFEITLGAMVFLPNVGRKAAWGLIALLIAVFPANVHMALHPALFPEFQSTALWVRLPVQLALIAWAYWHTLPNVPLKRVEPHGAV